MAFETSRDLCTAMDFIAADLEAIVRSPPPDFSSEELRECEERARKLRSMIRKYAEDGPSVH
jgi:DNA repair ATPase RecN